MKIELNGWQRLWVVLSAIYLGIVILFTWTSWPNKMQIESSWVYFMIDATKEPDDYAYQICEAYKDIPDRELIQRINAKYGEKPEYKEKLKQINLRYQKEIQSLGKNRYKTMGIAFIAWVIPIGIIYLMGLVIGWIYKGFKEKRNF